jgi:excisionase family DNA binding protein
MEPLEAGPTGPQDTPPQQSLRLLLTPEEAATALGIKRTLLYQLIMTRQIFSVKVGSARRVPVKALHDYVEGLYRRERAG